MLNEDVFRNRLRSNYEEIKSYIPRYWNEILEMDANNRFAGFTIDKAAGDLEQFVKNWFFDTMDEATLTEYENFLGLTGFGIRNIQDRRNLVKATWIGGIKMSRPRIKALIKAYLGCDSEVHFTHELSVQPIVNDSEATLYLGELQDILYAQIPAHLMWDLVTIINYGGGANIASSIRHWSYPHELCGTNPDIATLGAAIEDEIIIDEIEATYAYPYLSESDTKAGTVPNISTAGAFIETDVTVTEDLEALSYPYLSESDTKAGTVPDVSTAGAVIETDVMVTEDLEALSYPYLSESDTKAGTVPDVNTAGMIVSENVTTDTEENSNLYDVPSAQDD